MGARFDFSTFPCRHRLTPPFSPSGGPSIRRVNERPRALHGLAKLPEAPGIDADPFLGGAKLAGAAVPFPDIEANFAAPFAEADLDDVAGGVRPLGEDVVLHFGSPGGRLFAAGGTTIRSNCGEGLEERIDIVRQNNRRPAKFPRLKMAVANSGIDGGAAEAGCATNFWDLKCSFVCHKVLRRR